MKQRRISVIPLVMENHRAELHRRIQRRAYELWQRCGCPHGAELDHWLQAEREVMATPPAALPITADPPMPIRPKHVRSLAGV